MSKKNTKTTVKHADTPLADNILARFNEEGVDEWEFVRELLAKEPKAFWEELGDTLLDLYSDEITETVRDSICEDCEDRMGDPDDGRGDLD